VHRYGRTYPPRELVERVVGGPIQVAPFLAYLNAKLRPIYGLD
jgi:carboxypeptidase Taq